MDATCSRLKMWLLRRWLAEPPSLPVLRLACSFSAITATFEYKPPGPYNTADSFELQLIPTQPELVKALGDALDWCTFYEGAERTYVVDRMPAERSFRFRLRAKNARGVSAWTEEQAASTSQVPLRCGGTGRGYVWDQTPEGVEVEVALPVAGASPRDVAVEVKPSRVRISLRGEVLLEGRLSGEVLAEEGEWEWEVCAGSLAPPAQAPAPPRVLRLTLCKRLVSYEPGEQWSSLLSGPEHPRIDTQFLSWTRDRPWRPAKDASTREEVARALPGNRLLERPVSEERGGGEGLGEWGGAWRNRGGKLD